MRLRLGLQTYRRGRGVRRGVRYILLKKTGKTGKKKSLSLKGENSTASASRRERFPAVSLRSDSYVDVGILCAGRV